MRISKTWTRCMLAGAASATVLLAGCGGSDAPPPVIADAVFRNGNVVTVNGTSTVAQAFAVKDGRFLAVGSSAAMQAHVGPNTEQSWVGPFLKAFSGY